MAVARPAKQSVYAILALIVRLAKKWQNVVSSILLVISHNNRQGNDLRNLIRLARRLLSPICHVLSTRITPGAGSTSRRLLGFLPRVPGCD
jgi:hypothetical protein